jgi:hypothetical protein
MTIGPVRLSAVSVAVLAIQLVIVSLIAAKYLYQRATCPHVWTRTAAFEPDLFMRGRYLSLRLTVDGCQAALKDEDHPPEWNKQVVRFPATLAVRNNALVAFRGPDSWIRPDSLVVFQRSGMPCQSMLLEQPINFYIAEHAESPVPVKQGDELWIEVTIPPKGPPRPTQLALKHQGMWQPLTYR